MVGAVIEWYDFFIYGTAAGLVFGPLFFSELEGPAAQFAAFGTFAIGFLARPVGGLVFGHFGDRIGRKTMLLLTLIIMGVGTAAIGLLPSYDAIGVLAPVLLVVLRVLQGIGIGGEYGGAVPAVEYAPARKRGFHGSFAHVGVPGGLLLASVAFYVVGLLPDDAFMDWGWRACFLISVPLLAIGAYIRLSIMETPAFERVREQRRITAVPLVELLRQQPRTLLLGMGTRFIEGFTFKNTRRLKFLVALRPGLVAPTLAAQMATTFQNQSEGRLLLNVVTGGEPAEQKAFGDFLSKDERYERCNEFLTVVRELWKHGEPVDFTGKYLSVEQARLQSAPSPAPPLYFGGSSAAAGPVAAEHSDVYLTWGEPLDAVRRKIEWIRTLAFQRGRTVKFGIRMHVITRDTAELAWAEAERLLKALPPETIAKVQEGLKRSESEGQRRMLALHSGDSSGLEIAPNLWAGVGLGRGGAGTALVGSHQEVAERIREYAAIGIDEFVLSGYPHLEEAYWFGEGVLPLLEADGLWTHPDAATPLPVDVTADIPDNVPANVPVSVPANVPVSVPTNVPFAS